MYNLKIKNKDTQVTIRNTNFKSILNTVERYQKIGGFQYEIDSDEDPELTNQFNSWDTTIKCNRTFYNAYINKQKS